ncbi:52 kDa repressor of the inhibitor of the protein kinase [Eumeta japonica]|uniref:52 kDa repressor of the inhibitor of the protein kinase n=1 Tax=Eumeta variegata TaxID=151549 RepID=A0A4C1TAV8_EUMVA|nr:52 kDa repressor of the inhibitor of the protein kinase [Eumeta japonica]
MVFQRLFDIILTLAKTSLALRGHREDLSQEGYHGNFLSFVELVAQYDHILWQVLDMPKGSTRYLSATIQNEMIESLGTKLETHLLEQIRASPFFAIIMDTTQDISKVDQLSIVVSIKRWDLLSKFTGESDTTLKKLNQTRWSSRVTTISAIKLRFFDIIKALSSIVLKNPNKDEHNEAESNKTKMLNFEFVLLCEFMHSVLNDINYASKTLQKCDINLGEASKALAETKGKLQIYRNDFELFKCKASETARKYGIDTHFQEKRQRKVKKHFDELAAITDFQTEKKYLKLRFSIMY